MTDQVLLAPDPKLDADWWRQATVYQIYPRSFADSNGDGIGDLAGVTSRIGYLAGLGVDAIWLSPFYPSALADGGYDVADYRNVAPELGTLDDFDALVAAAHADNIKVIVDIVPNHTSDLHPWFVEALASEPGSAARARYIFRDGTGPNGSEPPSDWISHFGGPAWTRVPDGQWYCHLFAREQPDLNWDNPEVRADFRYHPAVLGRPGRGRLSRRRRARAGQGPLRAAAQQAGAGGRGPAAGRHRPALRPQRGARHLRRVARGVQRVRPAADRGRRGVRAVGAAGPVRPAHRVWARRSTSTCSRPTSTPSSSTT